MKPLASYPERHDVDTSRIEVFSKVLERVKKTWFEDKYGDQRFWLIALGVLPEFQGLGIASLILRRVTGMADSEGLPVMLFTSVMGKPVYLRSCFETVGKETVRVEGQEEVLVLEGMLRLPQGSRGPELDR